MSGTCKTCRFWKPRSGRRDMDWRGECHRRSPLVRFPVCKCGRQGYSPLWPPVKPEDFCGDHKGVNATPQDEVTIYKTEAEWAASIKAQ